jgi:hypothetical protein
MGEKDSQFEARSRELFAESVAHLDAATLSRLTRARHAALSAAATPRNQRVRFWAPAAGVAAALLVSVALWTNLPRHTTVPESADNQSALEDIDIVASNEELDLLDEDIEFYSWAEQSPEANDEGMG